MKVFLLRSTDVPPEDLAAVHALLAGIDGPLRFETLDAPIDFGETQRPLSWGTLFGRIAEVRRAESIRPEDYLRTIASIQERGHETEGPSPAPPPVCPRSTSTRS